MKEFDKELLKKLYKPPKNSHKGQNGKLFIIGGSELFHAASIWALKIASKIVDMVYYSSVPENNEIILRAKEEFRDGIVVRRGQLNEYIQEADCVLIGPGLPRPDGQRGNDDNTKELTEKLLKTYPSKKWVVDGGSLQVIEPSILPKTAIITPHKKEFISLFNIDPTEEKVQEMAERYSITILAKGEKDIVYSKEDSCFVSGGNPGLTKGGTGDVLAGLTAALYCKNGAFLSASCASYINKKAGDELFNKVGYYYNASDLINEIPLVMRSLLL